MAERAGTFNSIRRQNQQMRMRKRNQSLLASGILRILRKEIGMVLRTGGEVGMRIHEMTISMVTDNGLMPATVTYNSSKRIVSGARLRFGWFFIRIGARILYVKECEGR